MDTNSNRKKSDIAPIVKIVVEGMFCICAGADLVLDVASTSHQQKK